MEILRDVLAFRLILGLVTVALIVFIVYLSAAAALTKPQPRTSIRHGLKYRRRLGFVMLCPIVFLFSYLGALNLLGIYADRALEASPNPFWSLWLGAGGDGSSLLTSIMWVNVLVAIYLWLSFRSYRKSMQGIGLGLYAFYIVGLLFLMLIQFHYREIARAEPDFELLVYPSASPAAVTDVGPAQPG